MKIYASRQNSTLDILKKVCQTDIWIPVRFKGSPNSNVCYINVRRIIRDKFVECYCIAGSTIYEGTRSWGNYNQTARNMIIQYKKGSWYPDSTIVDQIEPLDVSRMYTTDELLEMTGE